MENAMFNNLMNGNQTLLTSLISSANKDIEKSKKVTEDILSKYFIKSTKNNAEYYYEGREKVRYYNIISETIYEFGDEVIKLAKDHIRINIKMIEKRPQEVRLAVAKSYGHLTEDLNFTVFDLLDNIFAGKYAGKRDLLTTDALKCIVNTLSDPSKRTNDRKVAAATFRKDIEAFKEGFKDIKDPLPKDAIDKCVDLNYVNIRGKELGNLKTMLVVYLGCEIIMETDFAWLEYYTKMK